LYGRGGQLNVVRFRYVLVVVIIVVHWNVAICTPEPGGLLAAKQEPRCFAREFTASRDWSNDPFGK
jgi:hypothetical protein